MKRIYLLPNLFTTGSLFCGLLAILHVFNVATSDLFTPHRYELACWLIIAAAVLDLLDGWVARMTRTESLFGVQYDSLADVVSFGVAPAILIYTRLSEMENRHAAEVITILFCICGALRLARFNVQKSRTEKLSFTGLPIPAAAGTVVTGFLFFQSIDPDWDKQFVLNILPVMMVGLSYLMVSKVNYPSFKQLRMEGRKRFDVLPLIVLMVAMGVALKNHLAALMFIGFVGYVAWGLAAEAALALGLRPRPAESTPAGPRPHGGDS
jgi:CDP-diacylglycerol--serine O-phosphatidyltransferase